MKDHVEAARRLGLSAEQVYRLGDTCNACWDRQQRTLSFPQKITGDADGEGLRADYVCWRCGAWWFTGWAVRL